ncbi:hypothetical protein GS597_17435 [Synechococcales cyanobacterium C]|uniref:Uncharacterized protein n=1 Tax=Petrachloros mirabilis ULC683 TaxID=2781853 RepID=A0A8K2A208_9CYAN|nr:hypothetical protein [Petrachloros mirabilis]NCJ08258.1 hypothetical protein [Petrachloros mirabilis ULC683]
MITTKPRQPRNRDNHDNRVVVGAGFKPAPTNTVANTNVEIECDRIPTQIAQNDMGLGIWNEGITMIRKATPKGEGCDRSPLGIDGDRDHRQFTE